MTPHDAECVCGPCLKAFLNSLPPRHTGLATVPLGRPVTPRKHGTPSGYNAGCRLECCTAAVRDYQRRRRAGKRAAV